MEETIKSNWDNILDLMKKNGTSAPVIDAWIRPLKLHKIDNDKIIFIVNSDQRAIEFMKKKFLDMELSIAIQEFTQSNLSKIEFVLANEIGESQPEPEDLPQHQAAPTRPESIYKKFLNPKYTFDSFVIGENNQFAHATCVAVAESPAETYNPLFLYGGVGLGKTHLMHSIAHYILDRNPDAKVLYVTSEKFTNELIESIKEKKTEDFRKKYRDLDVLLIDDIQFIKGKENTQEEFFHTFNTLYEAKKQIIISSDRAPKDLDGLPDRLISRFESGVPADINSPNYETRMAILRKKAEIDNLKISDDIMQFIASNITSNIRELEGALNKIFLYSKLSSNGKPIDVSFAEEALKDIIKPDKIHEVTAELIIDIICEHYHITSQDIHSNSRSQNIAHPRQIVMFLCKKLLPNMTLKEIGESLGGKNHTTIIHGCKTIENEIEQDEAFKNTIDVLIKKITSN